jgi:hypothetical protein
MSISAHPIDSKTWILFHHVQSFWFRFISRRQTSRTMHLMLPLEVFMHLHFFSRYMGVETYRPTPKKLLYYVFVTLSNSWCEQEFIIGHFQFQVGIFKDINA